MPAPPPNHSNLIAQTGDVDPQMQARSRATAGLGHTFAAALQPGHTLGRFVLGQPLGTGGTATVFAAHDTEANREVALKVLRDADAWRSNSAVRRAFLAEARALAKLSHRGIVRVYDAGVLEGHAVLVMERVHGRTFEVWLEQEKPSRAAVLSVIRELCDAVGAAHAVDIVHRDIKPSNVVVRDDGGVTLLDFGLARAVEGRVATASSVIVGTAGFIAPERLRGDTGGPAVDQFALAALAAFGLGGPIAAVGDVVQLPSGLRGPLTRALSKALCPDPSMRYGSVSAFARELRVRTVNVVVIVLVVVVVAALAGSSIAMWLAG